VVGVAGNGFGKALGHQHGSFLGLVTGFDPGANEGLVFVQAFDSRLEVEGVGLEVTELHAGEFRILGHGGPSGFLLA